MQRVLNRVKKAASEKDHRHSLLGKMRPSHVWPPGGSDYRRYKKMTGKAAHKQSANNVEPKRQEP